MSSKPFVNPDGKTLDAILSASLELLEDYSYGSVKEWRKDGGKVIGHFQVYFPEEIEIGRAHV